MADNKNYQKTESRTATKKNTRTVSVQSIKYLVKNPLAVNYQIKQEVHGTGDIHAKLQHSN